MSHPELGVIEGYYGRPWSWESRAETAEFLAGHGYRFYLYAPKADPRLRRRWREPHGDEEAGQISRLSARCRELGMRFGIGLSPIGLHLDFGREAKGALKRKLASFDALGIDDLALLFDDMRGDTAGLERGLADAQADIVLWAAERTRATRVLACPSYYTDDPALDRALGDRPEGYLERLGALLDPEIRLFWTGEEVVSRELSPGHLDRVAERMGRKPFLWDNYPVNDGERMSQFLHVRGFAGRSSAIGECVAGHGVNPALQPTLTRIPALTLVDSYAKGDRYAYGAATRAAAIRVLGEDLGERIWEDLLSLQEVGLDRLGERAAELRARYAAFDHPGAREVIAWLDGEYRVTDALVQAQSGES